MTNFGYTLSSEEFAPNDLVDYAREAEERGYDFVSISDHYHPWVSEQGHAPFVWSTLGGVATATEEIDVVVGVSCPIVRIHPAILAQATATTARMLGDRFVWGVGTGENLNEHILGDHWPPHRVRLEMLEEAVEVVRKLWDGGQTSHYGEHYTVENARLFTRPEETPPIAVSAYGERAATAAADFGDGFWCVGPQEEPLRAFEENGGEGPKFAQMTVCYAEDEDEAVETTYEQWPNSFVPGELASILPTPTHFEQASQAVSKEDVREADSVVTDPDPETHIESVQQFVDAGYDHVYVHQVGDDQESFFEFYENEVWPSFDFD
ncbi:TIGR03557 family F420-dependent LLM class oxidoreductase [Haloprofundus halophilus]|uniref:TIGR03557 family F420-dependent LLM class oxidoreductase n=1 Tax=Haloprofundus halophilus TaxID=2283527 RepID=UPI000E447519|nr:TIGR03557 family F420-dependent LLM class oxidoreductase [Haloprofundus halophilus]